MKLIKIKYRTMDGDIRVNSYLVNVSKKLIKKSGIDPEKELMLEVTDKQIIIKEK